MSTISHTVTSPDESSIHSNPIRSLSDRTLKSITPQRYGSGFPAGSKHRMLPKTQSWLFLQSPTLSSSSSRNGRHLKVVSISWMIVMMIFLAVTSYDTAGTFIALGGLIVGTPLLIIATIKQEGKYFRVFELFVWLIIGSCVALPQSMSYLINVEGSPSPSLVLSAVLWHITPLVTSLSVTISVTIIRSFLSFSLEFIVLQIVILLFGLSYVLAGSGISSCIKAQRRTPPRNNFHSATTDITPSSEDEDTEGGDNEDAGSFSGNRSPASVSVCMMDFPDIPNNLPANITLIRSMSDELKGPVSTILHLVQDMRNDPLEKQEATLQLLESVSTRTLLTLNSYLDVAKIGAEGITLENRVADLEYMMRLSIKPSIPPAQTRNIPIYLIIDVESARTIVCDEMRIAQICSNFVDYVVTRTRNSYVIVYVFASRQAVTVTIESEDETFDDSELCRFIQNPSAMLNMNIRLSRTLLQDVMGGEFSVSSKPFRLTFDVSIPHEMKNPLSPTHSSTVTENVPLYLDILNSMTVFYLHDSLSSAMAMVARAYVGDRETKDIDCASVVLSAHPLTNPSLNVLVLLPMEGDRPLGTPVGPPCQFLANPFGPLQFEAAVRRLLNLSSSRASYKSSPLRGNGGGGSTSSFHVPASVLIAEDNIISAKMLQNMLEKSMNLRCEVCENGKLCVDVYTSNPYSYDVIFMDVCMPVMDGITAIQQIRSFEAENSIHPGIPIFAISANSMITDEDNVLKAGANGYYSKPINKLTVETCMKQARYPKVE